MLPMVPGACTAGGAPLPRRRRCLANSAPVGVAALLCALLASAGPSGAAASSSPSTTGTRGGDYGGVVINEIMYNERSGNKKQKKDLLANEADADDDGSGDVGSPEPGGDWVELLNAGDAPADVTGWTFRGLRGGSGKQQDKEDEDVFEILPALGGGTGTGAVVIPPGAYLVLARNLTKFAERYPEVVARTPAVLVNGSFGFNLSPKGELLTLRDGAGELVEAVEYDDEGRWPEEADGGGFTLELIDPELDRNNPFSWLPSDQPGGTPGANNGGGGSSGRR